MTQETSMERASFLFVMTIVYGPGGFSKRAVKAQNANKKAHPNLGPMGPLNGSV
jgi:hypothetical protein